MFESSSIAADEVHSTGLLSRIAHLSAFLVADSNSGELTPTKRVELTVKLFTLEYRILVQRNQTRKLVLQQKMPQKQSARRRSRSTSQPFAETEEINDPVQPAEQLEASAFSDPVSLAASFSLEPTSTVDGTDEPSLNADELQPATATSPIGATSSNLEGEQTAVSELTEPEQVCHLPSSPSAIDPFTEAVNPEATTLEPQDDSQTKKTKTLVIETKVVTKRKGTNKKKPSTTGKNAFSHSQSVNPKRRKRKKNK